MHPTYRVRTDEQMLGPRIQLLVCFKKNKIEIEIEIEIKVKVKPETFGM